jgi:hypothetical protein
MPKAKDLIVDDLPKLRELDINELFEEMDALDCPIDMINDRLVLDGAFGYQHATEGILNAADFYDITDSEYEACERGIAATIRSMNQVFERLDLGVELVEVDLAENMGYMIVKRGASLKKIAKNISEGRA